MVGPVVSLVCYSAWAGDLLDHHCASKLPTTYGAHYPGKQECAN
jgi:hypothetical protein